MTICWGKETPTLEFHNMNYELCSCISNTMKTKLTMSNPDCFEIWISERAKVPMDPWFENIHQSTGPIHVTRHYYLCWFNVYSSVCAPWHHYASILSHLCLQMEITISCKWTFISRVSITIDPAGLHWTIVKNQWLLQHINCFKSCESILEYRHGDIFANTKVVK